MVDTTVLVAGNVWPRFPYEVLQHALRDDLRLVLSPLVIAQARRKFAHKFPDYAQTFESFLGAVRFEAVPNPNSAEVLASASLMRDVNDIPVALSAIAAKVDYFVSDDKDYTDPNQPIHAILRIRLSGTFLNEVMGWSHEELGAIRRRRSTDLALGSS